MIAKRNKITLLIWFLMGCGAFSIPGFTQEASRKSDRSESEPIVGGENFKKENLIVWCIVPFDAKNRGPEQRAKMVRELGLKRVAYDWRKQHIPEFEQEILEYKKNGLEYFAFWGWEDSMAKLIKKHEIKPQIWDMFRGKQPTGTDEENVKLVAAYFEPVARKAKSLGLSFGIYNHGGWAGMPENLMKVCNYMREKQGLDNVGIVYNLHHGHDHIAENFAARFNALKPYLMCVNLNGMAEPESVNKKTRENKILPIGSGVHDRRLIKVIVDSGYDGPIGVLGHRKEMDAKEAVQLNLDGLATLVQTSTVLDSDGGQASNQAQPIPKSESDNDK